MDKQLFYEACEAIIENSREQKGIGTLSEKTLHAVLKKYFEPHTDNHEIKLGKYVADIVCEDGIIEIQTRNFNKLREKLQLFLDCTKVTIVYPIAQIKWLVWIDKETGEVTKKRKSPKAGSVYDAFPELYKIKPMLKDPHLHLCLVMLELTEYRYLDGWSNDKKKGSTRCERIPTDIIDEIHIDNLNDYKQLVPKNIKIPFTTKMFSKATKSSPKITQTTINILYHTGAIKRVGKQGNAFLYEPIV